MSHTAFFYGTLMAPQVLHRVIYGTHASTLSKVSNLHIRPALLAQHQRHKVKGADYPAVIPCSDSDACVRGTLVSGLTDADLWRLDIFEGEEYERRKVRVRVLADDSEETSVVEAETYIWIVGAQRLESVEWDFDEFVKEKMARWVGGGPGDVDQGFQDVDSAVAAMQDPTGGRGSNGDIARALEEGREREEEEKAMGSAV